VKANDAFLLIVVYQSDLTKLEGVTAYRSGSNTDIN
jgi:hypothetical protein